MDSLDQAMQNFFGDRLMLPAGLVRDFLTRRLFDEAKAKGLLKGSNESGKIQRYYERGSVYQIAAEKWCPRGVDSVETLAAENKLRVYVQKRLSER